MDTNDYLPLFIEESQEHIQAMNDNILALEKSPKDLETVNSLFRSAHTLKGMAGAMQFDLMANLTHEMESLLDELRAEKIFVTEDIVNIFFRFLDVLERQLGGVIADGTDSGVDASEVIDQIRSLQSTHKRAAFESEVASASASQQTAECPLSRKTVVSEICTFSITAVVSPDSQMPSAIAFMVKRAYEEIGEVLESDPANLESDEFSGTLYLTVASTLDEAHLEKIGYDVSEVLKVAVKRDDVRTVDVSEQISSTLQSEQARSTVRHQSKSVRVDVDRLDTLMNLYSEFVIDKTRLEELSRTIQNIDLQETVQHLNRVGTDLQEIVMKIRMVPLETVFNRFPRMVRDLSKSLSKKVNFEINGADTEVDRAIADEIGDSLIHILRNSMDHGLESPESRERSGKNPVGTVQLSAYHVSNHVFIEISDDGRGIDREKVLNKAVQQGLLQWSDTDSLSDEEVYDLLFHSGFSTAEQVSDISGRGVGLDAVRSKIQELSGDVTVRSNLGQGSTFLIRLPLTVSILSAMLVTVEDETFAIPTNSIVYIDTFRDHSVETLQGKLMWETRGKLIPLIFLKDLLHVPDIGDNQNIHVIILSKGERMIALGVNDVLGQQEVVLKSLGSYLNGTTEGISGATILGDGRIALIVDTNSFIR